MERYGGGAIVVAEYDPAWATKFEAERATLHRALSPLAVTIEHMGSTAVPGLPAKPIIDLLVVVATIAEAKPRCLSALPPLGYTYITAYETFLPGELFFRKGIPGPWTHHVHVLEHVNPRVQDWLLFRDYLRAHPETARAYAELKKALAVQCGEDIACYRTGKNTFVDAITAQARAEREASATG